MKNICLIFMAIAMVHAEYIFAGKIRELEQQKYDAEMSVYDSDDDIQIYEDFEITKEQGFRSPNSLQVCNSVSFSSSQQNQLSYDEERKPLMSDDGCADDSSCDFNFDDDVSVHSEQSYYSLGSYDKYRYEQYEKEFLRIHRSDAARISRLMNRMGSSLAVDEHICDRTVSIIDQIRKENQLMKQAHAKRYAEVLSNDNL